MSKDVYQVIKNPNNYFLPYEVWVKGEVVEWIGREVREERTRRIDSFRTEQKAMEMINYYKSLQEFKMQGNSQ